MKSKQLANVLVKILGLSVCLYAIPTCVSGILVGLSLGWSKIDITVMRILSSAVGAGVQAAVGIFLVIKSQKIAGLLFKGEDE
jgi:hypothetical protein